MKRYPQILVVLLIITLSFSLVPSHTAFADEEVTAGTPMPDIVLLQQKVDEATAAHEEVNKRISELELEIAETNARISDIQDQLPGAREASGDAAREYYVMLSSNNPLLEIFLGATSMEDFFAKIDYTSRINQSFIADITKLTTLEAELEAERTSLEEQKASVENEEELAEETLKEAKDARAEAQATIQRINDATAAATAAAAAEAAAQEHTPESPLAPSPGAGTGGAVNPGLPEAPADKQAFVDLWAPRIDAYLAGSPMAGTGYAFANAAYDYNVDPRWSPAIACLESSKGNFCFLPYNAWGWGSISWPDWETAIYSHVRGLSQGYGYTISEGAAQKYCPPNWQYWYSFISIQMASI